MKWNLKGLIFDPREKLGWALDSALQPTPLVLENKVRVYFGGRDGSGISRIGYVDLSKSDVTKVLGWSESPALDIGEDGCFDDSGVVPSAVIKIGEEIFLFYAGYQLSTKVRFCVLGGLAVSRDGGHSFKRVKRTPVFERTNTETLFRVPHSVLLEDGIWKVWYGGGDRFTRGQEKSLPIYNIRYIESSGPYSFGENGKVILETQDEEYRLGRPYLFKKNNEEYYLFYGYSSEASPYKLGYAFSKDLKNWQRQDSSIGLSLSNSGWDSQMMAYPAVIRISDRIYMLYNGNDYGKEGFGVAELIEW